MDILPYQEQDKEEILDLIVSIQREEFQIPITAEQQPDLHDIKGFYQAGSGNFWVSRISGKLAGTVSLRDIGNGQAALRKMFVAKEFRGKPHDTAYRLLSVLMQWSRSRQLKDIFLGTTPQFKAAHRFYEKHGFIEISREDLPPAFPVMTVDKKFYRYPFSGI